MVTKKEIRKYYGIFKLSQIELANRLSNYITNSIHVENEFLYVPGDSKVCVVAHLDTVHKELPQIIIEASVPNGTKITSENGIGADDRCGIIASLVLYNGLQEKPHLLFTYDEEIVESRILNWRLLLYQLWV